MVTAGATANTTEKQSNRHAIIGSSGSRPGLQMESALLVSSPWNRPEEENKHKVTKRRIPRSTLQKWTKTKHGTELHEINGSSGSRLSLQTGFASLVPLPETDKQIRQTQKHKLKDTRETRSTLQEMKKKNGTTGKYWFVL